MTEIVVQPSALTQPSAFVTTTQYTAPSVASVTVKVGAVDTKVPPIPKVQATVEVAAAPIVNSTLSPAQIGPLFVGAGVGGLSKTVNVTAAGLLSQSKSPLAVEVVTISV